MGKLVKNYFYNTKIENWNYEDFNKYLKILGYKNEKDILRTYNRILKEFADYNHEDKPEDSVCNCDRTGSLLESSRKSKREFRKVFFSSYVINIYKKYKLRCLTKLS